MSTCLGLYVEKNIVKYAKVTKDNDIVKIDSFGIKFYDKLQDAIKQIIEETYSYKIPISINITEEVYNYFYVFSLLNKKDIQNVINTEFESICYENNINKDAIEARYVLTNEESDKDKIKVIHVSANKADIAKKLQQLEGYRVTCISPIGTSIGNLIDLNKKENIAIVNIEDRTTLTTITNEKISNIEIIDEGITEALEKICIKENSYSKAYEICKNTTIYTNQGKDLQYEEENEYIEDIMPILYNIVTTVKKLLDNNLTKIDRLYITGTASVINNIDIYFQEYLTNIRCEILKPYFLQNIKTKVNIKDYIEVNSPVSLALQGLGEGVKAMNFKKESIMDKLPQWLTQDVGGGKVLKNKEGKPKKLNYNGSFDFSRYFKNFDRYLVRCICAILSLIIIYSCFGIFINNRIDAKQKEIESTIAIAEKEINKIETSTQKLKDNTSKYINMRQRLEELNAKITQKKKVKKAIPTLMNQLMSVIPKEVQLTSVQNNTGTHIIIDAQAERYEQLGYFISKIKNDGILTNIVSDKGQKQGGVVRVTIEGELP